jgi:hypothetical protein
VVEIEKRARRAILERENGDNVRCSESIREGGNDALSAPAS